MQKAKKTKRKRNAIDANDKFERRKMQNRRAAQTSREKKKKYVDNLEKRSLELEAENSSLQAQVLRLLKDNALMKTQLSPATLPTPTTVAPYLTQDIPRLPQVLPTSPCLASESAVLPLPQQPEASKGSKVMPNTAAVQKFVALCFMILCAMSNNPTSYASTRNKRKLFSATARPSFSTSRSSTKPTTFRMTASSSCLHNQSRVSLESHQNALSSDRHPTQ